MQAFLLILIFVSFNFIGNITNDFYLSSLPLLQEELNINAVWAKLSYSIWFIGGLLGQIPGIIIVEKFKGKKAFWLISLVFIIATFICTVSQNIYQLIGARLIQSFIIAVFSIFSLVTIQNQLSSPQQVRYFSANNIVGILSPIIGPTLYGLLIGHFSWRFNFELILISLISITFLFSFIKLNSNKPGAPENSKSLIRMFKTYIKTIQNEKSLLHLSGPGLLIGGIVSYLILSPFIIVEEYKVPIHKFNLYHSIPISGYIIGICLSNLWSQNSKPKFISYIPIVILQAIVLIALLNFLNVKNIFLYLSLIAVVNFCIGYINNIFILNALATSPIKTMTAAAIGIIGGLICSSLTVTISLLPYDKMTILAFIYAGVALFVHRYNRKV